MSDTPPAPPFHFSATEEAALHPGPEVDTAVVRDLALILKETDLTSIEVERGPLRIRVAREMTVQAAPPAYAPAPATAAPQTATPASPGAAEAAPPPVRGDEVKSPMVGTVYLQAKPGDPAFVKAGDTVAEGQTLLIVEAMKTMNPIPAPRTGRVAQVLVGDGQPVEYGEALVVLE